MSELDRLRIEVEHLRAELDKFKPEPMSQRCRDGHHNGTGDDRCINCWCLCHQGDQIIPWGEVRPGHEVLIDGEFMRVDHIDSAVDYGNPILLLDDMPGGLIPAGTFAAVRRDADPSSTEAEADSSNGLDTWEF